MALKGSASRADSRPDEAVAVVGLGAIGAAVARRLRSRGWTVVGHDTDPLRSASAGEHVEVVGSIKELVSATGPVWLIAVRTGGQLREVLHLSCLDQRRRVVVVLSTVGPTAMREVAHEFGGPNVSFVDAPVSGGAAGAATGALTLMVSAPPAVAETVEAVLSDLGQVIPVGDVPGAGQAVKLANQLVMAGSIAAAIEATAIADAAGVGRAAVREALQHSTGRGWVVDNLGHVLEMWDRGTAGPLGLLAKDVELAHDELRGHRPAPLSEVLAGRFSAMGGPDARG